MTSTEQAAPLKHGCIPVAPLRAHIQRWLDQHGDDAVADARAGGSSTPLRILAERIWPDTDDKYQARIYRLLEQEGVSFDLADRIVTIGLEDPWLWRSDPELAEAYQNFDLRPLDASRPTCQKVADKIAADVRGAYERSGSIAATMRETGLPSFRVEKIVREAVCA